MQKALIVVLFMLGGIFSLHAQHFSEADFTALQSLVGLWKMETPRGAIYEEWQVSSDHTFTGRSYRVRDKDTVIMEHISLYREGGDIIYSPIASGQNNGQAVPFKLISNTEGRYVFENKGHDFPQRIRYWREGDALNAEVSLIDGGKAMRWRYTAM